MTDASAQALLTRLIDTSIMLHALFDNAAPKALRQRAPDDAFAPIEHLCHLRDIDREGFAIRVQRILEEDDPVLADLDGGRLASERGYLDQDCARVLEAFTQTRARIVELLRNMQDSDWQRTARLDGTGWLTLKDLVNRMLDHDTEHLAALGRSAVGPTRGNSETSSSAPAKSGSR